MRRKLVKLCLATRWLAGGVRWCVLGAGLVLLPSQALAQEPGVIAGRVVDALTGAPLDGAQISIEASPVGALAGGLGEYSIALGAGTHTVSAAAVGYQARTRTVALVSGATVTLDFPLTPVESAEEALVVPVPPFDTVSTAELPLPYDRAGLVRHRQVFVNPIAPPASGDVVDVALFADAVVELHVQRSVARGGGNFEVVGSIPVPGVLQAGEALILVRSQQMTGSFHFDGRLFEIRPYQGQHHVIVELTPTGTEDSNPEPPGIPRPLPDPPSPDPPSPDPTPPIPDSLPRRPFPVGPLDREMGRLLPQLPREMVTIATCSDLTDLMAGPYPEIRILALVTDKAASQGGDIATELELRVLELNHAFETSRIPTRAKLVGVRQVAAGDDGSVGAEEFLSRLETPDDTHLDDVGPWRDEARADIVLLYTWEVSGLGKARTLEVVTLAHEWQAFVVVNRQLALSDLGFHHEMGHVLGGQHHDAIPSMKPYRYNHARLMSDKLATIMAIPQTGIQQRVLRFSNPNVSFAGLPTGVLSSSPNAADNSRAIANTSGVTSAFRLTPAWFGSVGARAPWSERRATDTSPTEALFGDFDGDGETDAIVIDAVTGAWSWIRSASEDPVLRNGPDPALALPASRLAVGDFDGDGKDDVFWTDEAAGVWWWASAATGGASVLNGPDASLGHPVADLAFGRFDNDATTDVFRSDATTGEWFVSFGGSASWTTVNPADASRAIPTSELVVSDFDADGKADVLRAVPASSTWEYSVGGSTGWQPLVTGRSESLDAAVFGDFDGDGTTDALKSEAGVWMVSNGAANPWVEVRRSCYPVSMLALGDFDGDGTVDVLRLGIRP